VERWASLGSWGAGSSWPVFSLEWSEWRIDVSHWQLDRTGQDRTVESKRNSASSEIVIWIHSGSCPSLSFLRILFTHNTFPSPNNKTPYKNFHPRFQWSCHVMFCRYSSLYKKISPCLLTACLYKCTYAESLTTKQSDMDSTFLTHFPPPPPPPKKSTKFKSERKYVEKSEEGKGGRGLRGQDKTFKDMKGNETTKSSLGGEGEKVRRFHRLLSSVYLKAFGCSSSSCSSSCGEWGLSISFELPSSHSLSVCVGNFSFVL
jgi:hypothetical protein